MTTFYARTKRDQDKLVGQFASYVSEWQPVVGLSDWDLFVHGTQMLASDAPHIPEAHDGDRLSGSRTFISISYLEATILLIAEPDSKWEDRQLEEMAAHELVHIVLAPVMFFLDHEDGEPTTLCRHVHLAEENICTRLARALMAAKYQVRSQPAGRASGTKGRAERQPSQVA